MGDMGDAFNSMREATKKHRAAMLAAANTGGWTMHTPWHFSRIFSDNRRMDWWPSGGKAQFDGRMIYGHKKVNALIARLVTNESNKD